ISSFWNQTCAAARLNKRGQSRIKRGGIIGYAVAGRTVRLDISYLTTFVCAWASHGTRGCGTRGRGIARFRNVSDRRICRSRSKGGAIQEVHWYGNRDDCGNEEE